MISANNSSVPFLNFKLKNTFLLVLSLSLSLSLSWQWPISLSQWGLLLSSKIWPIFHPFWWPAPPSIFLSLSRWRRQLLFSGILPTFHSRSAIKKGRAGRNREVKYLHNANPSFNRNTSLAKGVKYFQNDNTSFNSNTVLPRV